MSVTTLSPELTPEQRAFMSKQRDAILYWTISRSIRLNTRTYEETVHSISFWLSKFTLSPCMQSRMKELVMLNEQRKPRKKQKSTTKAEPSE